MSSRAEATKELLKELIAKMHRLMAKGDGDKELKSTGAETTAKEMAEETEDKPKEAVAEAPSKDDDDEMERFREFMRGGKKTIPKASGITVSVLNLDKRLPPAMRMKSKGHSFGKSKAKA